MVAVGRYVVPVKPQAYPRWRRDDEDDRLVVEERATAAHGRPETRARGDAAGPASGPRHARRSQRDAPARPDTEPRRLGSRHRAGSTTTTLGGPSISTTETPPRFQRRSARGHAQELDAPLPPSVAELDGVHEAFAKHRELAGRVAAAKQGLASAHRALTEAEHADRERQITAATAGRQAPEPPRPVSAWAWFRRPPSLPTGEGAGTTPADPVPARGNHPPPAIGDEGYLDHLFVALQAGRITETEWRHGERAHHFVARSRGGDSAA